MQKKKQEWKVEFHRSQSPNGEFHTKPRLMRGEQSFVPQPAPGLIHGTVHKLNRLQSRFVGDVPSLKKAIYDRTPKTDGGKSVQLTLKNAYRAASLTGKAAVGAALISETAVLKLGSLAGRSLFYKAQGKLRGAALGSGTNRAAAKLIGAAAAVARVRMLSRSAKIYRTRAAYRHGHYESHITGKLSKTVGLKSELKAEKVNLKQAKHFLGKRSKLQKGKIAGFKKNLTNADKKSIVFLINKRKIKLAKAELKLVKIESNTAKTALNFKRKLHRTNKRILNKSKHTTFKEAAKGGMRVVGRKLAEADNDFAAAGAGIARAYRILRKPASEKFRAGERKLSKLKSKHAKKSGRLHKKESRFQNKKGNVKRAGKLGKQRKLTAKNKIAAILKGLSNLPARLSPKELVKNIAGSLAKKFLLSVIVPILPFLIGIMLILSLFVSLGGSGTIAAGTFLANEAVLTQSAEYYIEQAFGLNAGVLGVPNNHSSSYWNNTHLKGGLTVDYSPFKLWAFLTAYYYDFNLADDEDPQDWQFNAVTKVLIKSLFNEEYEYLSDSDDGGYYYTVNRKQSFDKTIAALLATRDDDAETREQRLGYYELLSGTGVMDDGGEPPNIYGGHQVIISPVSADLPDLIAGGRIIHRNGYDFWAWNTTPCDELENTPHKGIDIRCSNSEAVRAVSGGTISNLSGSEFELDIPEVEFYDEDNRLAKAFYKNVRPASGIANGSEVNEGDIIGYVTADRSCGEIGTNYYLHFEFQAHIILNVRTNLDPYILIE